MNYDLLFDITLSHNLCNFHILFFNNLTSPFTNVFSIVIIKYVILDNLLHTTRIVLFLITNGN